MPLTDVALRGLKPATGLKKITDGDGLQIWVFPNGSRLWRFAYRFGGKQKLLALGSYPEIGLRDARRKRDDARDIVAAGRDPAHERKIEKIVRATSLGNTFSALADEYLLKKGKEGLAPSTLKRLSFQLKYLRPVIGDRPIAALKAPEVLAALRPIEAKNAFETAIRTKELAGAIFRYAMATGRADTDPTQALRGALITPKTVHRAAITEAAGFGALLRTIDEYDGHFTIRNALQLLALVFTRPGELRLAQWSEFDLDGAVWKIPAGRMKMRVEHWVPLARQTIDILRQQKEIAGRSPFVLPSIRGQGRPISENTLNVALRTMGYTKNQMTAHGFRAAASTLLNESNCFSPDAIERALAHKERDEIRGAYNRGAYWAERVSMAQWWADYLDKLRGDGNR